MLGRVAEERVGGIVSLGLGGLFAALGIAAQVAADDGAGQRAAVQAFWLLYCAPLVLLGGACLLVSAEWRAMQAGA